MDSILVVVFENGSKAYEGSQALREMEIEGSIHLYAKAVLIRDTDGKVQVKQSSDLGAAGTASRATAARSSRTKLAWARPWKLACC